MPMVPVISFVGNSGVGKTTFLEKLVRILKARGYRVAAVKHDVHNFTVDYPGKDSWRPPGRPDGHRERPSLPSGRAAVRSGRRAGRGGLPGAALCPPARAAALLQV